MVEAGVLLGVGRTPEIALLILMLTSSGIHPLNSCKGFSNHIAIGEETNDKLLF